MPPCGTAPVGTQPPQRSRRRTPAVVRAPHGRALAEAEGGGSWQRCRRGALPAVTAPDCCSWSSRRRSTGSEQLAASARLFRQAPAHEVAWLEATVVRQAGTDRKPLLSQFHEPEAVQRSPVLGSVGLPQPGRLHQIADQIFRRARSVQDVQPRRPASALKRSAISPSSTGEGAISAMGSSISTHSPNGNIVE
jgi:hypothetical protein